MRRSTASWATLPTLTDGYKKKGKEGNALDDSDQVVFSHRLKIQARSDLILNATRYIYN